VFICLHKSEATVEYYGRPFQQRRHFMRRICEQVGIEPFTYHGIRHLTASILFRKGYSVGHIQLVLRHKSPRTTELYLRSLGLEAVREALQDGLAREGKIISFEEEKKALGAKKMTSKGEFSRSFGSHV
jgi:integrase